MQDKLTLEKLGVKFATNAEKLQKLVELNNFSSITFSDGQYSINFRIAHKRVPIYHEVKADTLCEAVENAYELFKKEKCNANSN